MLSKSFLSCIDFASRTDSCRIFLGKTKEPPIVFVFPLFFLVYADSNDSSQDPWANSLIFFYSFLWTPTKPI